jgi:hypothetical protein
VCIDIKQKDLQIGMLEVVENKGANLRFKGALMGLIERKGTIRARAGQDKHDLVYHIFTGCQMIFYKYNKLNRLREGDALRGALDCRRPDTNERKG